jgi:hypothetical protein
MPRTLTGRVAAGGFAGPGSAAITVPAPSTAAVPVLPRNRRRVTFDGMMRSFRVKTLVHTCLDCSHLPVDLPEEPKMILPQACGPSRFADETIARRPSPLRPSIRWLCCPASMADAKEPNDDHSNHQEDS